MADYPPFMNAYGLVPKILEKIREAKTPDRFTQDFLGTKLGFTGGSAKAFIPLAKRLGLLGSDGTPTDLYKRFRNPAQSGQAIASAIRNGYNQLFERNEYAQELDRDGLEGLVMEITGLKKGHQTVRAICSTFNALAELADFEDVLAVVADALRILGNAHEREAGRDVDAGVDGQVADDPAADLLEQIVDCLIALVEGVAHGVRIGLAREHRVGLPEHPVRVLEHLRELDKGGVDRLGGLEDGEELSKHRRKPQEPTNSAANSSVISSPATGMTMNRPKRNSRA